MADAAETIISFAVKQVFDRVFGGPTKVFTAYHQTHFKLLWRVLWESERDWNIQEATRKIDKSLKELESSGSEILKQLPKKPEPPSSDLSFLIDKKKAMDFEEAIAQ